MEVDLLLLGFSDLSGEQQALFLEGLNRYLFVSPSLRRQLRLRWEKSRAGVNDISAPDIHDECCSPMDGGSDQG